MTSNRVIWFLAVTVLTFPILLAAFRGDDGITSMVILQAAGLAVAIGTGTAWLFGKRRS